MGSSVSKAINKEFWIDSTERIEYYLNNLSTINLDLKQLWELKGQNFWTQQEVNYISFRDYKSSFAHWYCKYLMPLPGIRTIRALPFYKRYRDLHSLIDFFLPFDRLESEIEKVKFPLFYGESGATGTLPMIRKARRVTDPHAALYDLRSLRYNTPCHVVDQADVDWHKKNSDVVWRGATTGTETRERFVKTYFEEFNIGFSTAKQKPHLAPFVKGKISIAEQLKSKFIVSLQGNDLASNIRWVLYSNSVLLMPEPQWTSWTMEEKLEPYVHYLPLNESLTNLGALLEWASNNDDICREIAQNGRSFAMQFLDRTHDTNMRMRVLQEYANRLNIIE